MVFPTFFGPQIRLDCFFRALACKLQRAFSLSAAFALRSPLPFLQTWTFLDLV
jgi:hypothetical protein